MSESLSIDEIRERRRQKILARSDASSRVVRCDPSDAATVNDASSNNDDILHACGHQLDPTVPSASDVRSRAVVKDRTVNGRAGNVSSSTEELPGSHHRQFNSQSHQSSSTSLNNGDFAATEADVNQQLEELRQRADDKPTVASLRTRCLIMVVLGVVVRLCITSVFLSRFMQTMFYPFMAAEIALFGYERAAGMEWREDSCGSMLANMWLSLFQLFGVSRRLVSVYSRLLAVVAVVCDDFSVYFFTFIVTHLVFT